MQTCHSFILLDQLHPQDFFAIYQTVKKTWGRGYWFICFFHPFLPRWLCVFRWLESSLTLGKYWRFDDKTFHNSKSSCEKQLSVVTFATLLSNDSWLHNIFFQPFIQGNFLLFKIARRHEKIFSDLLALSEQKWSWLQGCCFFGPKSPLILIYTPDLIFRILR